MIKILLLMLAVSSIHVSLLPFGVIQDQNPLSEISAILEAHPEYLEEPRLSISGIKDLLHKEAPTLNEAVIEKAVATLMCADHHNIEHNHYLTIIDYSLPSSDKRLWVFDLKENKLVFHTYVSHGIKSGVLESNFFSNKYNSKASSIGVYKTQKVYYGRHGLSLALNGLDSGFNDNAAGRAVVMHGGWYVDERFIKKYGRAGRSWGCPAVPENVKEPLINTIKDNSLFVVYYPSDRWFASSKFLTCEGFAIPTARQSNVSIEVPKNFLESREYVLFANVHQKSHHADSDPIVTMPADAYERVFHIKPPLERMLRRQINETEYIALSNVELNALKDQGPDGFNSVSFVVPVVKMVRGYYATEMQIVSFGKIKEIAAPETGSKDFSEHNKRFTVYFEAAPAISLRSTNQFIRWLGL